MSAGQGSRDPLIVARHDVCLALSRVLADGADVHRCSAAKALGSIGDPEAVEPLIAALLDEDEDVRVDAVEALSRIKDPRAGKGLLENLLGDPNGDVKLGAIEALSRMGDRQVVPWLRRLLKGRDEEIVWDEDAFYRDDWDDWVDIQVKSIQGLALMKVDESVPDIVAAIEDEEGQDLSEVAFKALAGLGRPGIEALTAFLAKPEARLRRRAAAQLGASSDPQARAGVTRAFKDGDKEVRSAAARALAQRDPADQRFQLLLRDGEADLRAFAVEACGHHHAPSLGILLDDRSAKVQRALLDLFAGHPGLLAGDVLLPWVNARLASSDPALIGGAAHLFAILAPDQATPRLSALLVADNQPAAARLGAIRGLAFLAAGETRGDEIIQVMVQVLGDKDRQIRLEAMSLLGDLAVRAEGWPNRAGDILLALLRGELIPAEADDQEAEADPVPEMQGSEDPEEPLTTLQSIVSPEQIQAGVGGVTEISEEDEEFLALARDSQGKQRVSITEQIPAHKDARLFAARLAGEISAPEAVEALISVLRDDDPDIRTAAAESLAHIARREDLLPAGAMSSLAAVLPSLDRDSRLFVIRALGLGGDQETARVLKDCLADGDVYIRAEAVRALSSRGEKGSWMKQTIEDSNADVRLASAEALARAEEARAVDPLVEFAFAFEGHHRREAALLLRGLDIQAANSRLVEILADPARVRERLVAIEALEELNKAA